MPGRHALRLSATQVGDDRRFKIAGVTGTLGFAFNCLQLFYTFMPKCIFGVFEYI